jgi:ketosteroid isomerase-like protein
MSEHVGEADTAPAINAAEVHRRVVELFAAGRRDEALALIDPEVVDHRGGPLGDQVGRSAWKAKWERMNDGIQDFSMTIETNVASGDFSVHRYTVRGLHVASGRRYEVTGIDMVRTRDGKLVEHWALLDSAAMRHQLGTQERSGAEPREAHPLLLGWLSAFQLARRRIASASGVPGRGV